MENNPPAKPRPAPVPRVVHRVNSNQGPNLSSLQARFPRGPFRAPEGAENSRVFQTRNCEFFKPTNRSADLGIITALLLRELRNPDIGWHEAMTHFGALMSVLSPQYELDIVTALSEQGITRDVVLIPSQADEKNIGLNVQNSPYLHLLLGLTIITLFKQFSDVNYTNFMSNRIKAMSPLARFCYKGPPAHYIPYDLRIAKMVKASLGNCRTLKATVLLDVVRRLQLDNNAAALFAYVADILAWSDMNGIIFMHETLIVTQSPVLSDPSVQDEVLKLREACLILSKSEMQQYHRHLGSPSEAKFFNRNNFPTLVAVATRIKEDQSGSTLRNFVVPANANEVTVNRLVALHRASMVADRNATAAAHPFVGSQFGPLE